MRTWPSVYVLVLNWNNPEATETCLRSLSTVKYAHLTIVVIDNASTDNSIEHISKLFQHIHIIRNEFNLGYAGGNNVGIRYALHHAADFILILNNDTVVDKDFLEPLVEAIESDPRIGVVGAKTYIMGQDRVIFSTQCKFIKSLGQPYLVGFKENDSGKYNRNLDSDCISGSCMLVRREVFETAGLMNEDYFIYLEDVEFCLRAQKNGYRCIYVWQSIIWHQFSGTFGYQSPRYLYYLNRNRLFITKQYNDSLIFWIASFPYFIVKKLIIESFGWILKLRFNNSLAIYRSFFDFFLNRVGKVSYFDK